MKAELIHKVTRVKLSGERMGWKAMWDRERAKNKSPVRQQQAIDKEIEGKRDAIVGRGSGVG